MCVLPSRTRTHFAALVLSDVQIAEVANQQATTPQGVTVALEMFNGIKANYPADPRTLEAFRGWLLTSSHGKKIRANHPAPPRAKPASPADPSDWRPWLARTYPGCAYLVSESPIYASRLADLPAEIRSEYYASKEAEGAA